MENINLLSLIVFTIVAFFGAVGHWFKKKRRNEIQGTLYDYMIADAPGNTTMMVTAVLVASVTAAMTGALDGLDVHVIWDSLKAAKLPMPTAHALISAFTLGWMADSGLNKGGK